MTGLGAGIKSETVANKAFALPAALLLKPDINFVCRLLRINAMVSSSKWILGKTFSFLSQIFSHTQKYAPYLSHLSISSNVNVLCFMYAFYWNIKKCG